MEEFKTPATRMFWLGSPGVYTDRKDLQDRGLPDGDQGGRELQLPTEVSPGQFYDLTMPFVKMLQADAQRKVQLGEHRALHPFGVLAQGVQVTWIFASMEIEDLKTRLAAVELRMGALERRLAHLENSNSN